MDANIAVGHFGRKGRVVIPLSMRGNLKQGETLLITKQGDQIVLRKASAMERVLQAKLTSGGKAQKVSPRTLKKALSKQATAALPRRDKFGHFLSAKKK